MLLLVVVSVMQESYHPMYRYFFTVSGLSYVSTSHYQVAYGEPWIAAKWCTERYGRLDWMNMGVLKPLKRRWMAAKWHYEGPQI